MARTGHGKVEEIAFEVGRLVAKQNAIDEGISEERANLGPDEFGPIDEVNLSNDLGHAIASLSLTASFYRPISPVGVMFQLLIADHEFENVISHIPQDVARKHVVEEMVGQVRRQLRGSIEFLEQCSGTPLSAIGGSFYVLNAEAGAMLDANGVVPETAVGSPPSSGTACVSTHWASGSPRPAQPIFACTEDQLLALTARYDAVNDLSREIDDIEARTGESGPEGSATASDHALRMHREIVELIIGTHATTVRELGLKARIAFDLVGEDWYGDAELSWSEKVLRSLVQDAMAAAGVTVIPTPDASFEELRERARNGRWHFEPAPVAGDQKAAA